MNENWIVESTPSGVSKYDPYTTSTSHSSYENENRFLVSIIDILGRETPPIKNTSLLYIYDDGTVEKKIILE